MEGKVVMFVALLVSNVFGIPEDRIKRGYNTEHGGPVGYGVSSDERGASIEEGSVPCGIVDNSGSRELGYGPEGPLRHYHDHHNGVHTSVKAAAAASASSYNN